MKTFVLVHGARGRRLDLAPAADATRRRRVRRLRAVAHRVGDREHLASADVGLDVRAHAALEDRVEAAFVADLQVKGFGRPVQAFELLRGRERATS